MKSTLSLTDPPSDPAELFIRMYRVAASWPPDYRTLASLDQPRLERFAIAALEHDDSATAMTALHRVLPRHQKDDESRGQFLAIMKMLDNVFQRIHPIMRVGGPMAETALPIPTWLRSLAERRVDVGYYAVHEGLRALPRGPLLRTPRGEGAASADSMADRFRGLAVVHTRFQHDGRTIELTHKVVTADRLTGVPMGSSPGAEHIVHVPLAVASDDLNVQVRRQGQVQLFDFSLVEAAQDEGAGRVNQAAERFLAAAEEAPAADIVLGPEFMVSADAAVDIGQRLADNPLLKHRLIAAGSGASVERDNGLAWNQVSVFNALGVPLWTQRKLWPAAVATHIADGVGHPLPAGCHGMEDTRSGEELAIVDVDTLGRCAILICQDLKLFGLNALLHELQCDWVLVPVLDTGLNAGRWTHKATFGLTEDCQTRFVVGSSLSLVRLLGYPDDTPCLMAVGPRLPSEAVDAQQAFIVKSLVSPGRSVSVRWREEQWGTTWVGAREA